MKKVFVICLVFFAGVYFSDDITNCIKEKYNQICNQTSDKHTNDESDPPSELADANSNIKFNFVKNSNVIPIDENMVMKDDGEFNEYAKKYDELLNRCFYPAQVKSIREIIISDCEAFGNGECGLCSTQSYGHESYSSILIATKEREDERSLLHECCHTMYYDYLSIFNKDFKKRWLQYDDDFVTDYAKTDIVEDFAETGSYYLYRDNDNTEEIKNNPKLKLFEEFYLKIKNLK